MNAHSLHVIAITASLTAAAAGCGKGHGVTKGGTPPEQVSLSDTQMTFGFALSVPRIPLTVSAFKITRFPISVADYQECVKAGACTAPAMKAPTAKGAVNRSTYSAASPASDLPVTYVGADQAATYCTWVGGRLPRLTEWMLAVRGPDVHRFPWGDSPPTCEHGPLLSYYAGFPNRCCGNDCDSNSQLQLSRHPAGRSPFGLEDVLVAGAELIGPDGDDHGQGCGPKLAGCLVSGLDPSAVDGIAPAPPPADYVVRPYDFRCVWDDGDQP